MSVKRQHALMHIASITILCSFVNEPLEKRQTFCKTFWMPLDAKNALVFAALNGLDDAIGRIGCRTESGSRITDCLMMERVDKDVLLRIYLR